MKSTADLWGYTTPFRPYIRKKSGPNFNGIDIAFNWTNALGTLNFRKWVAATGNNSVHEFRAYCFANGLPQPLPDLKILFTRWGDDNVGAAPMLDKMSDLTPIISLDPGIIAIGVFRVALDVPSFSFPIALNSWLTAAAPDIVYNINDPDEVNADDIRETMYHELAHSIHFMKAGPAYWNDQITFVVNIAMNNILDPNDPTTVIPYGNGTRPGSGRCAIIEAWGFQNGKWAAHLRYGLNHSNGLPLTENTWQAELEDDRFEFGFIPSGWQHDLIDNNLMNPTDVEEPEIPSPPGPPIPQPDGISGFTRTQIFSTMTHSMLSANQQRLALQSMLPAGNTLPNYLTLALVYGL